MFHSSGWALRPCQLARLSIRAELTQVRAAAAWLEHIGTDHNIPATKLHNLDLCLEEALMNVIMHSGLADQRAYIELTLELHQRGDETQALITVSDTGAQFDPLAVAPRPQATSLADAEPGGLGLVILRSNADYLSYRFDNGRNHLTFGHSWFENTSKTTAQAPHT